MNPTGAMAVPSVPATPDVPEIVIFGDFNCPYSALASSRSAEIERAGAARVEWHAVEHDPTIPPRGEPVNEQIAEDLERELAQIRGMLGPAETVQLRLPSRLANTHQAVAAYAATPASQRAQLRQDLFAAYWVDDRDLSDPDVLAELSAVDRDGELANRWRAAWKSLPQQLVPVMLLPDGHVSRGLGALARLADAADGNDEVLHGI